MHERASSSSGFKPSNTLRSATMLTSAARWRCRAAHGSLSGIRPTASHTFGFAQSRIHPSGRYLSNSAAAAPRARWRCVVAPVVTDPIGTPLLPTPGRSSRHISVATCPGIRQGGFQGRSRTVCR
jgi:hypothetical protein